MLDQLDFFRVFKSWSSVLQIWIIVFPVHRKRILRERKILRRMCIFGISFTGVIHAGLNLCVPWVFSLYHFSHCHFFAQFCDGTLATVVFFGIRVHQPQQLLLRLAQFRLHNLTGVIGRLPFWTLWNIPFAELESLRKSMFSLLKSLIDWFFKLWYVSSWVSCETQIPLF